MRKSLSQKIIKTLFALSGNQCAFPNCTQSLIQESVVVGEICHMEALSKGGSRHSTKDNKTDVNSIENLVLLCSIHHQIIDAHEKEYSVEKLKEIKQSHEEKIKQSHEEKTKQEIPNIQQDFTLAYNIFQKQFENIENILKEIRKSQKEELGIKNKSTNETAISLNKMIFEILQPTPIKDNAILKKFKTISHENVLSAYSHWLESLKLLSADPYLIEIIQGLHDEGVDLIIKFLQSGNKIGLQVKSYGDIEEKTFSQNTKSQITDSKKHGLSKLIIILCADLERTIQATRVRNLMSSIDQMGDDYVQIIQPQYVLPICLCHNENKHPLSFLEKNKIRAEFIQSLSLALSDDTFDAKISVNLTRKIPLKKTKNDHEISIKFKPFSTSDPENPIDKFLKVDKLGEPVTFFSDQISEIISTTPDGKTTTHKSPRLEMWKEKITSGISELHVKNDQKNSIKNLVFYIEKAEENYGIFKTGKESWPWVIELTITGDELELRLQLHLGKSNFKHIAVLHRFMKSLREEGKLILKKKDSTDEREIEINKENVPVSMSEDRLEKIELLEFLQDTLNQRIDYSLDQDDYNFDLIRELKHFLEKKTIEKAPLEFTTSVSKQRAEEMIEEYEKSKLIKKYELIADPMAADIVGQRLSLGKVSISMKNVLILDEIDELKEKVTHLSDQDKIDIRIQSKDDDIYKLLSLPPKIN